jgi:hypothetical protein
MHITQTRRLTPSFSDLSEKIVERIAKVKKSWYTKDIQQEQFFLFGGK